MLGLDRKQIIILVGFLLILGAIPISAVLVKQTQIFKSKASEEESLTTQQQILKKETSKSATQPAEIPAGSPLSDLEKLLQGTISPTPASTPDDLSPTPTPEVGIAFGPTLNVGISLEGRPAEKQGAKVFIGLASGAIQSSPTYLLTFTVDFPDSGNFRGLSLAGLNPGSTYTAYIKGPAQIDNASTFVMSPTETNLNSSQPLFLTTGDLNEDNTINSADYTIAKNLYGTTPTSSGWNFKADFNLDGIINNLDLAYIIKNFGKTGVSSTWFSPPPTATQSGSPFTSPASPASPTGGSGGYWLWIP